MKSQNVPGSGGRDFDTTRYWPSGVHAGETMICGRSSVRLSRLTGRGFEPSALAIHRFSTPVRSLRNAIVAPSGDQVGWLSNAIPPTMRVAVPPLDRQRVEVAEQVEDQRAAVGGRRPPTST